MDIPLPLKPLCLALAAAALPLCAQDGAWTGTVTDPTGRPVAGARVTLLPGDLTVRTGADGGFTLRRPVSLGPVRGMGGDASETTGRAAPFDARGRSFGPSSADRPGPGLLWVPGGWALRAQAPAAPLAKPAPAAPETLEVVAYGFAREERVLAVPGARQDVRLKALAWKDVPYKAGPLSPYEQERCKLDVHAPAGARNLPVLVHLHGGGLHGGDKSEGWMDYDNFFARKLMEQGLLVVSPNYRLGYDPDLPKTGVRGAFPDYLRDAAAAVAWAWRNAEAYGGDRDRFIVCGYSAGAWMAAMLTLDTSYYREAGFAPARVDGVLAFSVQTYTYPQVAWERGTPVRELSDAAMLNFTRRLETPLHLFLGGGEPERVAENREFVDAMKRAGTADIRLDVMPGRDHKQLVTFMGNPADATRDLALAFIRRVAP